jgi:hypothetical protein
MPSIQDATLSEDSLNNLRIAREFLVEALKWGKHVVMPFNPIVARDILLSYEAEILATEARYENQIKIIQESHERRVAELTGKIGGMQKKINALEEKK